jgi:hypothetical protein
MGKEFLILPLVQIDKPRIMNKKILLTLVLIPLMAQSLHGQEGQSSTTKSDALTTDTLSTSKKTQAMISIEEFLKLKDQGVIPEDIPDLLQALLLDASGDWDSAHRIAQNDSSSDGSWVHAYLHRKEGDLGNASYWYRSAGRILPEMSLEEEWEYIAMALLKKS